RGERRGVMSTAWARMVRAQPGISATVSPFIRNATRNPATCAGVAAPLMTSSMAAAACSSLRARPPTSTRHMSPRDTVLPPRQPEEIAQQGRAVGGKDGFGMKLHTLHRPRTVAQTQDLPFFGPRRDRETIGHRRRIHDEGVVADGHEGRRQTVKNSIAIVVNLRNLAVHGLPGPHEPCAKGRRNALVA